MGFMENEAPGYKSPLFGRRTAQINWKAWITTMQVICLAVSVTRTIQSFMPVLAERRIISHRLKLPKASKKILNGCLWSVN
ncbi:MAG: hypothetical protein FWF87_08755 [Synergistaceae bacterium]|nr:hypothetical protein [Synergistaceae bacterium]